MANAEARPAAAKAYSKLPEPVKLEDTIASQDPDPSPDPQMGHNTETEFMLRYAG